MKFFSVLAAASAFLALGTTASPLAPQPKRQILDVCAIVDADLVGDVLGLAVVFGALDVCLCISALPLFIETNIVAIAAADILGATEVTALLTALINSSKTPCSPTASSKVKRDHNLMDATCPRGHTLCGVQSSWSRTAFECIDTQNDLESCGGCTTGVLGQRATGQDCTAIEGVESVTCRRGVCEVLSCRVGHFVSEDGASCTEGSAHHAGAYVLDY